MTHYINGRWVAPAVPRDCDVIERSTLASCVGWGGTAVRGARGLALAEAEAGAAVREAQPMRGVATRPSAARPIP